MEQIKTQEVRLVYEDYKGRKNVWRFPRTRREAIRTVNRFLEFFDKCRRAKLLYEDLLNTLKECVDGLFWLLTSYCIMYPALIAKLKEVKEAQPIYGEVTIEKVRIRGQKVRCSICGVKLVYPAYLVYRQGFDIVMRSGPVGIFCLTATKGQIENLTKEIKVYMNGGGLKYTAVPLEEDKNGQLMLNF